jgi:hypothetical protein
MELTQNGWQHLDYADYGDGELSDEDFATHYRERDPAKVVSRDLIERGSRATSEAADRAPDA